MNYRLFTEEFRPNKLSDVILPNRVRRILSVDDISQHMLFYGPMGTGKTTTARILISDKSKYDYLTINASRERGIDTIREDISEFCSTVSLKGASIKKIVNLEELDNASRDFYLALRATMEEYAESGVRFIGSCNYLHKIPPEILSRFLMIDFSDIDEEERIQQKKELAKRIYAIAKSVSISMTVDAVKEFINKNYPDFRACLIKLQEWHDSGIKEITVDNLRVYNYLYHDILELAIDSKADAHTNYQFIVSKYSTKTTQILTALGDDSANYIQENRPDLIPKIPLVIRAIADAQYKRNFVINPMITLLALFFELQTILQE